MKKITKILAIVMAIAILACPLASAAGTAVSAGTKDSLNIEVVNNDGDYAVKATIESVEGFMVAVLDLDVAGIALDEDADPVVTDYSVIAEAADENTDAAAEAYLTDGVLTVYVQPKLADQIPVYGKIVVEVPVIVEDTYSVTATALKAASNDAESFEEYYVDFGFNDVETGAIDTEAAAAAGLVISVEGTKAPAETPIDYNITLTANVAIQDKIGISVNLTKSQFSKYDYSKTEVVFVPTKYDGDYNRDELEEIVNSGEKIIYGNSTMDYTEWYGVGMHEMALITKVYVRCYDANGNYVAKSDVFEFIPETLLKTLYKAQLPNRTSANASRKDRAIKTTNAIADLLVMGGEAQRYFQTRAKAGAHILEITKYNDSNDATYNFIASDCATADAGFDYDAATTYDNLQTVAKNRVLKNVAMGSAPTVSYSIKATGTGYIAISDASKLVLTASYRSYHVDKVNGEIVSEEISGAKWSSASGYYFADLSCIRLFDGNKEVTVTATYDGKTLFTDSVSVETLCKQNKDHSAYGSALRAVARFEATCRVYFGNK